MMRIILQMMLILLVLIIMSGIRGIGKVRLRSIRERNCHHTSWICRNCKNLWVNLNHSNYSNTTTSIKNLPENSHKNRKHSQIRHKSNNNFTIKIKYNKCFKWKNLVIITNTKVKTNTINKNLKPNMQFQMQFDFLFKN